MSNPRLAGRAWAAYKDNLLVQDIVETAIATLGIAGAQALFTEMSPEEIAMSGAFGVGAATVGRPLGDRAGRAVGRHFDNSAPGFSKMAGDEIAKARQVVKNVGGDGMEEVMQAKMKHHFDVPGRGPLEGLGSVYGRQYGDNIAQGVVGLAAPIFIGGEEDGA